MVVEHTMADDTEVVNVVVVHKQVMPKKMAQKEMARLTADRIGVPQDELEQVETVRTGFDTEQVDNKVDHTNQRRVEGIQVELVQAEELECAGALDRAVGLVQNGAVQAESGHLALAAAEKFLADIEILKYNRGCCTPS